MKIDIISGFLGAGKTTFIKRILKSKLSNEKVVLIENEFGEVSVDTDFLAQSGVAIKELSQGCICCSLFGDFSKSLKEVASRFTPDRIIIEPSGVGKLTDIIAAIKDADYAENINSLVCLVDASKTKMYAKNFGEFFLDQISTAHTIVLSRTDVADQKKIEEAIEVVRSHNPNCVLVATPIANLSDEELFKAYEGIKDDFLADLLKEVEHQHHEEECECGHHHHEEECECGHHHHEEECECGHHHHEEECECGHHHHEEECECGHHHHEEECECGHHTASEVFSSIGFETAKKYDIANLKSILNKMASGEYGMVVRAKGVVCGTDNNWYQFNLTIDEVSIEPFVACPIGKICVIGSDFAEEEIKSLF